MRVVVTGAAGFIGANLVKGLNERGVSDIVAVDDLRQGDKFRNLVDLRISDYVDAADFYPAFAAGKFGSVEAVFHQGACSDTMEHNGQYMLANNYTTTVNLFEAAQAQGVRLLYASSAATYGGSTQFAEHPDFERPLNVYGYSKLLTDQVLRQRTVHFTRLKSQVAGFRYFNVYGPREQHKGRMASVAYHQFHQFQQDGCVKLFGAHGGYAAGEQQRDFVYVDDVVAVNLWFFDHPEKSGVFNLGTGRAESFNQVALGVVRALKDPALTLESAVALGLIGYTPFPDALLGKYQSFTQADLSSLRAAGCDHAFQTVAQGVAAYMSVLKAG